MTSRPSAAGLVLISHRLCPYVQRASITLVEKGVPFERMDIDLAHKPDWFMAVSPLGKTPVLLVDGSPIFESAAICEYLDDTHAPRLHPADPLTRARHRGWMEYASVLLNAVAAFYSAPDDRALALRAEDIRGRLRQLEGALGSGPWFAGDSFSLVDAAFAPAFRYFDVFSEVGIEFDFGCDLAKTSAWRVALRSRVSVSDAVSTNYPLVLREFLIARGSALSRRY